MAYAPNTHDALAWLDARQRLRELRFRRHLAVGAALGFALTLLASTVDTLAEAALVPLLLAGMVSSLARGIDARFGHLWGWIYSEPLTSNRLDRLMARLIGADRPAATGRQQDEPARVRTIAPFD